MLTKMHFKFFCPILFFCILVSINLKADSLSAILSSKGAVGDTFLLSDRHDSVLSSAFYYSTPNGGDMNEKNKAIEKSHNKAYNQILNSVAKNKFNIDTNIQVLQSNNTFSISSLKDQTSTRSFPKQKDIDFGGLNDNQISEIYNTTKQSYPAMMENYAEYEKLADALANGQILSKGLEGLGEAEQKLNEIAQNFHNLGLSSAVDYSSIDDLGKAMGYAVNFSYNSRTTSFITGGLGALGAAHCCCTGWIKNKIKIIDDTVKQIVPKETNYISQSVEIWHKINKDMHEKIGQNFGEGVMGKNINISSAELLLYQKNNYELEKLIKLTELEISSKLALDKSKLVLSPK